jgi:hypothetical protein
MQLNIPAGSIPFSHQMERLWDGRSHRQRYLLKGRSLWIMRPSSPLVHNTSSGANSRSSLQEFSRSQTFQQQPSTGPYPEPAESNSKTSHPIYIKPLRTKVKLKHIERFRTSLKHSGLPTKLCCYCIIIAVFSERQTKHINTMCG